MTGFHAQVVNRTASPAVVDFVMQAIPQPGAVRGRKSGKPLLGITGAGPAAQDKQGPVTQAFLEAVRGAALKITTGVVI